jgi:hypothetical protein
MTDAQHTPASRYIIVGAPHIWRLRGPIRDDSPHRKLNAIPASQPVEDVSAEVSAGSV